MRRNASKQLAQPLALPNFNGKHKCFFESPDGLVKHGFILDDPFCGLYFTEGLSSIEQTCIYSHLVTEERCNKFYSRQQSISSHIQSFIIYSWIKLLYTLGPKIK